MTPPARRAAAVPAAAREPAGVVAQVVAAALAVVVALVAATGWGAVEAAGAADRTGGDGGIDGAGDGGHLATLVAGERAEVVALRARQRVLAAELAALEASAAAAADDGAAVVRAAEALAPLAGTVAAVGPGVAVLLDDAPGPGPPGTSPDDLVVHSHDVRAAVNALWRAGAHAVAVNGQRVVATSALRCIGTTLLVNGTRQPPPYVATAVGATAAAVRADPLLADLGRWSARVGLRLEVADHAEVRVPAFAGTPERR